MSLDWLTTARPLFTTLGPNVPWTRATIEERVRQAVDDGCDTVMAFVQDEGYALWPSRCAPHAPRAAGADLVAWWVEETHAAGLRFVAQWMGVHVQTATVARHPGWLQRDASGAPAGAMCLNSPFGDALVGQVLEIVTRHPVDGIYLDGAYARQGGCWCDACVARFLETTGVPLVRAPRWTNRGGRSGEHWLDFGSDGGPEPDGLAAFRFRTVRDFLARLATEVRTTRPGTAIILDTLGVSGAYWPNAQDPAALAEWVDAFALECYPDQLREPLWWPSLEARLLEAEGRRPVWMLRWIARDPDGDLVSVPTATLEAQMATAAITRARPTIVEMNLFSVDRGLAGPIARVNETARGLDQWLTGARPVRWAGVLASRATRDAAWMARRPRRADDPIAGAWLALTDAHVPVELVTERDLIEGGADGLAVLVVPDAAPTPEAADAIASLVRQGGMGLVATYRAAAEDGPLAGLCGLRTAGVGHRAGRIGTEAIGGGELVSHLTFDAAHEITRELPLLRSSFPGGFLRVIGADGAILGRIHDADFEAMDGERWFGWYPGQPTTPAGVARQLDDARVVAWAAPFDALYFRLGRAEHGDVLVRSCRWAARTVPPLEVTAPATVEVRAWRDVDGALVVAFANRTAGELAAIGAGVSVGAASSSAGGAGAGGVTLRSQHPRAIIALAGVEVRVAGVGHPEASTLGGVALRPLASADGTTFALPALSAFEAIRVRVSAA